MGFFSKLFGSAPKPVEPARDIAALAAHLALPAVAAVAAPFPLRGHQAQPVHSWFLGEPVLPVDIEWPQHAGRRLGFLASVDLAEMQAAHATDWLPAEGNLSFFYDMEKQPWGFDPKDRGAWRVIYQPQAVVASAPACRAMSFRVLRTYPPSERPEAKALGLTDAEWDVYSDLESAQMDREFFHQLGGHPKLIQADVLAAQSQLASNGVYCGDEKGWDSPRAKQLEPGATEWRLLFQLASDDSLDFTWGDGGNLYFMIREAEARAARFENAWLVVQCF